MKAWTAAGGCQKNHHAAWHRNCGFSCVIQTKGASVSTSISSASIALLLLMRPPTASSSRCMSYCRPLQTRATKRAAVGERLQRSQPAPSRILPTAPPSARAPAADRRGARQRHQAAGGALDRGVRPDAGAPRRHQARQVAVAQEHKVQLGVVVQGGQGGERVVQPPAQPACSAAAAGQTQASTHAQRQAPRRAVAGASPRHAAAGKACPRPAGGRAPAAGCGAHPGPPA